MRVSSRQLGNTRTDSANQLWVEPLLRRRRNWPAVRHGRRDAAICRNPGSSNRRAEHRANRGRRHPAHFARSLGLEHDLDAVSDKECQRRQSERDTLDLDLLAVGPDYAGQAAQDHAS
jgi:hypothetical protein